MASKSGIFFMSGTSKQFEWVLTKYQEALQAKADSKNSKSEVLLKLDKWWVEVKSWKENVLSWCRSVQPAASPSSPGSARHDWVAGYRLNVANISCSTHHHHQLMCQLIVSLSDAIYRDLTQSHTFISFVRGGRGDSGDHVLCVGLPGCGPGQVARLGQAAASCSQASHLPS